MQLKMYIWTNEILLTLIATHDLYQILFSFPAGYYCEGTNLTAPTDRCDAGHYCTYRVDKRNPIAFDNDSCVYDGKFSHILL